MAEGPRRHRRGAASASHRSRGTATSSTGMPMVDQGEHAAHHDQHDDQHASAPSGAAGAAANPVTVHGPAGLLHAPILPDTTAARSGPRSTPGRGPGTSDAVPVAGTEGGRTAVLPTRPRSTTCSFTTRSPEHPSGPPAGAPPTRGGRSSAGSPSSSSPSGWPSVVPTNPTDDADYREHESGRAAQWIDDAGLSEPLTENVLVTPPAPRRPRPGPCGGGRSAGSAARWPRCPASRRRPHRCGARTGRRC